MLFLLVVSFGSLERIDLLLTLLFHLRMSGKITGAGFPFYGRIRIAAAEPSCDELNRALTSFALLDYRMAVAAVVPTTRFGHEGAFDSRLHCCANHDNHPLFCYDLFSLGEVANNNRELTAVKVFFVNFR
jgi:hypothetical protein